MVALLFFDLSFVKLDWVGFEEICSGRITSTQGERERERKRKRVAEREREREMWREKERGSGMKEQK